MPRLVVFVAFDGVRLLDLAGPVDVFDGADRALRSAGRPPLRSAGTDWSSPPWTDA